MRSIRTKLTVSGVVLVAAFGYLALAGMSKGWVYFVSVDEYLADAASYKTQRVRLHGKVADTGFVASTASLTANFSIAGKNGSLPVVYRGTIPDMFQPGRDVVVEGNRDQAGVFQADVLMTKCASKYQSESPHNQDPTAKNGAVKS